MPSLGVEDEGKKWEISVNDEGDRPLRERKRGEKKGGQKGVSVAGDVRMSGSESD